MSGTGEAPRRPQRPLAARIAFWVAMAVIWIGLALVSMDTFGNYSSWGNRAGVAVIAVGSGVLWYASGRRQRGDG